MPLLPLSIVVPVYNEADNFPKLVEEIERHVAAPFTVFVVYDFAADTTLPVVQRLAQTRPWLHLVLNARRGVANALRVGIAATPPGPVLIVMGDLSDDLACVGRLRELYAEGYGVVCPSRYIHGGQQLGGPLLKGILSRVAGLTLHASGFPVHDATNNFRLYDADFVRRVGIESTGGFEIGLELTVKAWRHGLRITEVPTIWRDRTAGESKFKLAKWLPKYLYWYGFALREALS